MKIQTVGILQDILDRELSWRIKEIAELKTAVRTSKQPWQKTIIRAGVPLLYAHWEGFVKRACEAYVTFVSCQRLTFDELKSNFVVLGAKKHLQAISSSRKSKLNIHAVDFFRTKMNERADVKLQSAINTESNLSSNIFENIAISIGINHAQYESRYNFIDESLLKRRNNIAHGEYLELDSKSFQDLADNVLLLLRWVKTDIENSASTESYRNGQHPKGSTISSTRTPLPISTENLIG